MKKRLIIKLLILLMLLLIILGILIIKDIKVLEKENKEKPTIILEGSTEVKLCKGLSYQEEGYKAYDDLGNDITSRVKVEYKKDKIIYVVSDNSLNYNSIVRNIIYTDELEPEMKLNGEEEVTINVGDTFNEPGYTAVDNCDGDITDKVVVENTIDNTKEGVYYIKYKVSDNAGNKKELNRKINVIKKEEPQNREYTQKETNYTGTIYLTFDDGPSNEVTPKILNLLQQENIKATFFVTGAVDSHVDLLLREHNEGHCIALHTYSHNYSYIYQHPDNFMNDIDKINNSVYNITGKKSNIIRFPGGSSNTVSRKYYQGIMTYLTQKVLESGYKYYDWNVDSNDAGSDVYNAGNIAANVINHLNPNGINIVLMHDSEIHTQSYEALPRIIKYAKENNYEFRKIDETTKMITHRVNN